MLWFFVDMNGFGFRVCVLPVVGVRLDGGLSAGRL